MMNGLEKHRIFPFLWMKRESEEVLRTELEKIYSCGITGVCVESRPHPDFLGEGWWKDMDIIVEEAQNRDMKVWVLDDAHFPTGYANGAVKDHPHLGKTYLARIGTPDYLITNQMMAGFAYENLTGTTVIFANERTHGGVGQYEASNG